MVPPDDGVPEAVPDRPEQATGEISMLPPEEAEKVVHAIVDRLTPPPYDR